MSRTSFDRIRRGISTLLYALGLCVALTFASPLVVHAQAPVSASPDRDFGWLTVGIGPLYEFGGMASLNVGRRYVIQLARHTAGTAALFDTAPQGLDLAALSAGVGISHAGRWARLALLAGPAIVRGQRSSPSRDYDPVRDRPLRAIGGSLNAQVFVTPVRELGIGLDVLGNLNAIQPMATVSLVVVLEGNK